MEQTDVIIAPIITEKSMAQAAKGSFTFLVAKSAGKKLISTVVAKQFKVDVIDIATLIMKGKRTRAGKRRTEVVQSPFKKAIVRLAAGQKIDLFEMPGEEDKKKDTKKETKKEIETKKEKKA